MYSNSRVSKYVKARDGHTTADTSHWPRGAVYCVYWGAFYGVHRWAFYCVYRGAFYCVYRGVQHEQWNSMKLKHRAVVCTQHQADNSRQQQHISKIQKYNGCPWRHLDQKQKQVVRQRLKQFVRSDMSGTWYSWSTAITFPTQLPCCNQSLDS